MKLRFISLAFLLITIAVTSATVSAKHPITTAKDEWLSLRSKKFFLVGNAKEKDLRAVTTKLEQFRETFRLLLPNVKFSQAIETNVVVFKNKWKNRMFCSVNTRTLYFWADCEHLCPQLYYMKRNVGRTVSLFSTALLITDNKQTNSLFYDNTDILLLI